MRQLSRIAALLVGVAVICVVSGCGSGGTERGVGGGQAVFTFELDPGSGIRGVASSRGQSAPENSIKLWSKEPGDAPFPEFKPDQGVTYNPFQGLVLGFVSVINERGNVIRNVEARAQNFSNAGWEHNDTTWNYGAVDTGGANESHMMRWAFLWTGGGMGPVTTFDVTVTFVDDTSMPPPAPNFSLEIKGTSTEPGLPPVDLEGTVTCGTQDGATDLYDSGPDEFVPFAPPSGFELIMNRPEWAAVEVTPQTRFMTDIRAPLLSGGQSKTWPFVVVRASTGDVTLTWDTAGLPAGISVTVIDVQGYVGAAMSEITSGSVFTHPGFGGWIPFQLVATAT